ncbi:MAG: endopeptidase La [Candidatus Hydrogenedentes bacterium]|nr:endopeptidase La [Candidatus Hydrogenedentota bacterium]
MLPLKDAVIFPRMVVPLLVGRPASLAAVEEALASDKPLFLCTQLDGSEEEPAAKDMYRIGVAANILQTLRMPDGTMKVVVEGICRGRVQRFHFSASIAEVSIRRLDPLVAEKEELKGLIRTAFSQFEDYVRISQRISPEIVSSIQEIDEPDMMADTLCAYLPVKVAERQALLEENVVLKRLEKIVSILMRENELIQIEHNVRNRVREQMERGQREHYLQEQLKAIHQELGGRSEDGGDEFSEIRRMLSETPMPKEVKEKAEREFVRYERMPMLSPEGAVIRTYLEWLCDMPWKKRSRDAINLKKARRTLDAEHYGLEKVKERILEFLAVKKLNRFSKGPILCLVGPPGVGKTSLGESIAHAMNRKFVRVSLGGIRDEAEIRGHRRTYIGALPGRIIQGVKKSGVKNPVFLLDEVDKMNADFRGDPASALLEVLDPAQNKNFSDHYLEVDYDLSEVFFIATANNEYDIPHALHDRMEVVRLPGYTMVEKENIARLFLLPRQIEESGLNKKQIVLADDGLDTIIQRYTREAGVRELERKIAAFCRKVALKVVSEELKGNLRIDAETAMDMLGPPPYSPIQAEVIPQVGVAIGMAWTQAGGDILTIETSTMKGKGLLKLTGQLGDVMKESAEAAYTYIRSNAALLKVPADFAKNMDLHVHVPEGAIPKDGPSAGVALFVSMLSALTGKAPRAALSMTGEITLRGRVLPVGGIKEKVLAAHRAGIRHVIMPKENAKDLIEVPEEIRNDISFTLAEMVDDALRIAYPVAEVKAAARRVRAAQH